MSKLSYSQQTRPEAGIRSRLKQNFTAINVDDPFRHDRQDTPPRSPARREAHTSRSHGNGLRELIDRQDQLLSHQKAVASRQDEIASHLANQNQAMNEALLKQVLANKDNMISNLSSMQASEWDEHSRNLLAQHIRYISEFCKKLNFDFAELEAELKSRDMAVIGTNNAVNKLEVHHVTMLQDVRSRIVRAEQAISKHTKDIAMLMDDIRRVEGLVVATRGKLAEDIHRLEAEVISMTGALDRQAGVQQAELSHFKSNMNNQLSLMDERMKGMNGQFQEALDRQKASLEHHCDRMGAKFKTMIDKATEGWGTLMGDVDKRIQSNMTTFLNRLGKLEDRSKQDRGHLQDLQRDMETQVMAMIQESIGYNNAELARIKLEFRQGFNELQESLANLKGVVEGKRKILANKVTKEIGAVKRAMQAGYEQPEGNTIIVRNRQSQSDGW